MGTNASGSLHEGLVYDFSWTEEAFVCGIIWRSVDPNHGVIEPHMQLSNYYEEST